MYAPRVTIKLNAGVQLVLKHPVQMYKCLVNLRSEFSQEEASRGRPPSGILVGLSLCLNQLMHNSTVTLWQFRYGNQSHSISARDTRLVKYVADRTARGSRMERDVHDEVSGSDSARKKSPDLAGRSKATGDRE